MEPAVAARPHPGAGRAATCALKSFDLDRLDQLDKLPDRPPPPGDPIGDMLEDMEPLDTTSSLPEAER